MNILEKFKQKKAEFKNKIVHIQTEQHVKRAKKLNELRKDRVRLQGYEKVRNIEIKEKAEIQRLKENTPLRRNLKKIGSKASQHMKNQGSKRTNTPGNFYGTANKDNPFTIGSGGPNIFNQGDDGNNPFNFKKKKR